MAVSRRLLLVAGVAGASIGALGATWQWAVELAQVQAGTISYGRDTLATAVQGHLWSLVTQVTAVGLRLGLSELASSVILSACMTALAVQALSLTIFLFARDERYAVLGGLAVVLARAATYGATYPIDLLPAPHSLGAIGQSFSVLIPPLMASGYLPAAAFMAGLGIAVHSTTGVWALAAATVSFVAARERLTPAIARALAIGVAISIASFAAHQLSKPAVAAVSADQAASYARAFIEQWDLHRQPVRWMSAGVWFNVAALVLAALLWIRADRRTRLFLGFVVVSGVTALLAAFAGSLPASSLPLWFLVAIPGRFLNFDIVLLAPLLLGVTATIAHAWRPLRAAPLVLLIALAVSDKSPVMLYLSTWLGGWVGLPQASVLAAAGVLAALAIAAATARRSGDGDASTRPQASLTWASLVAGAICIAGAVGILHPQRSFGRVSEAIRLRGDEQAVFDAASRTRGSLLTASNLWLIQLRSRRPVVLDGGTLDTLPYAPEGGPFAAAVLQDVYGVSFFTPPEAGRHLGQLARSFGRERWERFTLDDWRRIAARYGVTAVVAYRDWSIALPRTAQAGLLALYEIPQ